MFQDREKRGWNKMRLILTGGGTGGHIYPLIAVYNELKKNERIEVTYFGKKNGMEEDVARKNDLDFFGLTILGMARGKPWQLFSLAILYARAIFVSVIKIRSLKPDVIFASGGYACFPACIAATILRVPFCLHEQNALPGKANLFLAKFASKTFVSFSSSMKKFKTNRPIILTGLPIRDSFFSSLKKQARENLAFSPADSIILITGGSRGASFLNTLGQFLGHWARGNNKIILITGKNNYAGVLEEMKAHNIHHGIDANVKVIAYADNVDQYMSAADLVICRAGATTIGELCALGKPSILIPFPGAAENHQLINAQSAADAGAAVVFEEQCFVGGAEFVSYVEKLISDAAELERMAEQAKKLANCHSAAIIAAELMKIHKVGGRFE